MPRIVGGPRAEKEGQVELEGWLEVYQALSLAADAKERSYWTAFLGFLLASSLLALAMAFLFLAYSLPEKQALRTVLGALGLCVGIGWWTSQRQLAREVAVWSSLLRGLEGEFAGAEFHRLLFKLQQGTQACIPGSDWKCGDWHPTVAQFPRLCQVGARFTLELLPLVFSLAWAASIAASWLA